MVTPIPIYTTKNAVNGESGDTWQKLVMAQEDIYSQANQDTT